MQITIVESEIKDAIRKMINDQINIKDGMQIDIDLSATRGADGFKAIIDIVPVTSAATVKSAGQGVSTDKVKAAPAPTRTETVAAATPSAEQAKPADTAPAVADEPQAAQTAEPAADAQTDAASDPAASAEAGTAKETKSLFQNLRKLVNTPAQ